MKRIIAVVLAIIMICSLTACGVSGENNGKETDIPTINAGVLTVGVSESIPFAYTDHTGNLTGIEVELLNEIAELLDLELEFKVVEFDALLDEIENSKVDCIASGMVYTPERNQIANATNPIFTDIDGSNIVMYIDKNNIKLQASINEAIGSLQKDGTFDAILSAYGIK